MYSIIDKIVSGRRVVGYRLKCKDKSIIEVSKDRVIELARDGQVIGIKVNSRGDGLVSSGIDLRKLSSVREGSKDSGSNYNRANMYMNKLKLLGKKPLFDVNYKSGDKVELVRVQGGIGGKFIVPSFITSVGKEAFKGCKYSELYIDNVAGMEFDVKELCVGMKSEELKVVFRHPECIKDMSRMFSRCKNLREIDISGIDTSNVENMNGLFSDCIKLECIKLGSIDTRNVKDMSNMFSGCIKLKSIDMSKIRTNNVVKMRKMFYKCESLREINVSKFNTKKVKDMYKMFSGCSGLEELDLSNFTTDSLNDIKWMFYGCERLKRIDARMFGYSVEDAYGMFNGCRSLVYSNMGTFSVGKAYRI